MSVSQRIDHASLPALGPWPQASAGQAVETPLAPESYWSEEWLARERANTFAKNWIFAGFAQDVAKSNDYLSFLVAGTPVIVRNMKGKLVAFKNVCSHRHSIIHPAGCGNALFRCPYHGWTYDAEGVPIGIPDNARSFGFDKEDKRELALDSVALESCGRFLFVRLVAEGPSLKKWLGPVAEKLEHVSELFTENYATDSKVWHCNWKSGIEIALEPYHAPYVHPATFAEHLKIEGSYQGADVWGAPAKIKDSVESTDDTEVEISYIYAGPHAISYGPLSVDASRHLHMTAQRLKLPRSDHMRGYEHFFIYPNLQIGVNSGVNFSVIRYEPLTPGTTQVECRLLTGMPADPKLRDGLVWRAVTKNWDEWNQSVLAEDRAACERAQLGVRHANHGGWIGEREERVRHFQAMVLKETEGERVIA